jgi:hypothetical protein
MRIAITFLGFLGMVAHFSQKVNVGITFVCMVNRSAIKQTEPNSSITCADDSCLQTNNTNHIVNGSRKDKHEETSARAC